MSLFICPICQNTLFRAEKQYLCPNGHSFDISSEGYVHLLPANKKHSRLPGDDKEMVRSRNRFLSAGYYEPLLRELSTVCLSVSGENTVLLDSGCGEGYYTGGILSTLLQAGVKTQAAGIDISKEAVRLASKRHMDSEFAVASSYHLPVANCCCDIVLNCFSPLSVDEFSRVLKKGGSFIYVVPAPRHLWELKCVVYDEPYENPRILEQYQGFEHIKTSSVQNRILLNGNQVISDLFTMTPYYWKTPQAGLLRLNSLSFLETEISFDIHVYRKQ